MGGLLGVSRNSLSSSALALAAVITISLWIASPGDINREIAYRLESIERGTITDSVSATGSISAVGLLELNAQTAGAVLEVLVDFNDSVVAGQLLAHLDPESFEQKVLQSEADLSIAKASLQQNRAAVTRAEAELRRIA